MDGDGPRLTQVFVNCIANASKFAPEDSVDPRRRAGATATRSTAWVEDEGPGVPGGELRSIFERFRRGAGQEPEPGGLGLGLWIVKSIVERHGGNDQLPSAPPQDRTRFSVTLPAESC